MTSLLKIAVVVVNWNAGDYLEKCLQCLKAQTLNPTRVIVVDNASTDGSIQGLEEEFDIFVTEDFGGRRQRLELLVALG